MIVDDDKVFLEELNETLQLSGYDMVPVNDPVQALDVARAVKPDVVLVDMKMPVKNGFVVAWEIGNCPGLMHVPIIAMSAYFKNETNVLTETCKIRSYLKKPFSPLAVISEIEEALNAPAS
jgi:CheY-like chemotaxis protein